MEETTQQRVKNAAIKIWQARSDGTFTEADRVDIRSLEEVNMVNRELLMMPSRDRVGWKIGLNNPELAFKSVGLSEPFTAPLMKGCLLEDGGVVKNTYVTPGGVVEAEWAFVMGAPLPSSTTNLSLSTVVEATRFIGVAIEIAGSCVRDGNLLQKLADHGLNTSVIYKQICKTSKVRDLKSVLANKAVRLSINGRQVAKAGSLNAVHELHRAIRLIHKKGLDVRAGDLIITGAVVKHAGLNPGDVITTSFQHPKEADQEFEVSCQIQEAAKL
eukprot:TRINITY_DN25640_c0_g1_i1.p1 TRINITY_DN25640_c0_g1~~TRINITY_DN25640_c0_g1_i1.p1  ORF type:complete len:272 (+),score=50.42 TRINITY_DN25640_c0_g1_i1:42-857(+)